MDGPTQGERRGGLRRAVQLGALGSACAVCERWQDAPICATCQARFGAPRLRCRLCAIELPSASAEVCGDCIRHPPPLQATLAAWRYDFPWDRLIARFKFHGGVELAGVLADGLAETVEAAVGAGWLALPELLLPVPLSPRRLRERGYNQAWELARRLARRWRLRAEPLWLERVRETPHQAELSRVERLHNLAAAFAVAPEARLALAGRRVALVDDVMTTGSTLAEAAATLRRAGVAEVQAWVLARTPDD
jgi:ComF family protein